MIVIKNVFAQNDVVLLNYAQNLMQAGGGPTATVTVDLFDGNAPQQPPIFTSDLETVCASRLADGRVFHMTAVTHDEQHDYFVIAEPLPRPPGSVVQ
jgi:hypothetical protein